MFTKFLQNMHEESIISAYSKLVFYRSPEAGGGAEHMKALEVNADLLKDAKQTLKVADDYMRQYNIDENSDHMQLYYTAHTIRQTLKNAPEIRKAIGKSNPVTYLQSKLRQLKAALKQVAGPLEKEKKKYESSLKRAISGLPNSSSSLQKMLSVEWRIERSLRLPKQFIFTTARFEGRTFLVRKNPKGELTISFTRPKSMRNYPLCIAGKVVNRHAMRTMMRFLRPSMRERRELANARIRNSHLATLNGRIEKGFTATHDIYPLVRAMRGWPKGTYKVPKSKLQVRVTASNVIVETDKARYYSLYTGAGRVTQQQFAQHVPSADMIPNKLKPKKVQGPVMRLASSLVGPQYVETVGNHYVVKFRNRAEQAKVQVQDIIGKPSDPKMLITVESDAGAIKQAMWHKDMNTWNVVDAKGKITRNRIRINNKDRFVDAHPQGQIFEEEYLLR
ncbi:hypothetical protein ACFL3C_00725 [Patescibacteria group bacterium]